VSNYVHSEKRAQLVDLALWLFSTRQPVSRDPDGVLQEARLISLNVRLSTASRHGGDGQVLSVLFARPGGGSFLLQN
jgi:hypothetical protein